MSGLQSLWSWIQEWWSWIGVSTVSAWFNLPIAFEKLSKECRYLVFFNPGKSVAFWLWIIINIALPAFLFWLLYSLSSKPAINFDLFTKSVTFGLVFTALVNAYVDTGFFGLDIKALYGFFTNRVYRLIAASQTRRAAAFWTDFTTDLTQTNHNLTEGLNFLENYFQIDPSLTSEEKVSYQKQLDQARNQPTRKEQVMAIKSLMNIRRKDLPEILRRFGCSQGFIKKYFS